MRILSSVISKGTFSGCTNPVCVIPDGVTDIRPCAFDGYYTIETLLIPGSVRMLSQLSFGGCCPVKNINIDESNPYFSSDNGVLYDKNKSRLIYYPSGKEDKEYYLPDSVITVEKRAFFCNHSLAAIHVGKNNANYTSIDGVLFNKSADTLIQYCYGRNESSYTVPESVTRIEHAAFIYCDSLVKVLLPDALTEIGACAFTGCSALVELSFPDNVQTFGHEAFMSCSSLRSIRLPKKMKSVGRRAFSCCEKLESVTIPQDLVSIEPEALAFCKSLAHIELPNSLQSIGFRAFAGCTSLSAIIIPDSVVNIDDSVFEGCEVQLL